MHIGVLAKTIANEVSQQFNSWVIYTRTRKWLPTRIILATVAGSLVGGVSSSVIVAIQGPVFHWEMAGMFMVIFSSVAGAIAGGLSAAVCSRTEAASALRGLVGSCVGAAVGLAVGVGVVAQSSASASGAPRGLAFWAVALVVIAGCLAGLVSGLMATTSSRK
jgi:hypothetical protein